MDPTLTKDTPVVKKKNTYFYQIYGRRNHLQEWLYDVFYALSSLPRLVLEVFIRRNMGERYFTFAAVLTVALLLGGLPIFLNERGGTPGDVVQENRLWYLFLAVFVGFGVKRWHEVLTLPSVFDLERFSLSAGESFAFLYQLNVSPRTIVVVLEPAMAVVLGALLLWVDQFFLGLLLLVCGVTYSLSYLAAIHKANNVIMQKLDQMICNEELSGVIVEQKNPRQARGFEFLGTVPNDRQKRERVVDSFWEEDDAPEVS